MRINTNVASLNAQRILGQTNDAVGKSIGRLSSGFRINRAADDAAGLGIANKLRADLRGLNQASRNAEQANSLLQVAEGAAQTVQSIVERMKELAVQSASDNVSGTDRALINAEFTQLQSEISRVVDTTQFQGSVLLNGSMGNEVADVGGGSTIRSAAGFSSVSISGTQTGTYSVTQTTDQVTMSEGGRSQTLTATAGAGSLNFDVFGVRLETSNVFSVTAAAENLTGDVVVAGGNTSFMVSVSGNQGGQDDVQIGQLDLQLATLGIDGDTLATKDGAVTAIGNLDTALASIATAFGTIGAAQNRIEYASQNVKATIENFSAAESVIRDADMAAEMASFTKSQILQQAGTAMLAQANSAPQMVLRLLQ